MVTCAPGVGLMHRPLQPDMSVPSAPRVNGFPGPGRPFNPDSSDPRPEKGAPNHVRRSKVMATPVVPGVSSFMSPPPGRTLPAMSKFPHPGR